MAGPSERRVMSTSVTWGCQNISANDVRNPHYTKLNTRHTTTFSARSPSDSAHRTARERARRTAATQYTTSHQDRHKVRRPRAAADMRDAAGASSHCPGPVPALSRHGRRSDQIEGTCSLRHHAFPRGGWLLSSRIRRPTPQAQPTPDHSWRPAAMSRRLIDETRADSSCSISSIWPAEIASFSEGD